MPALSHKKEEAMQICCIK